MATGRDGAGLGITLPVPDPRDYKIPVPGPDPDPRGGTHHSPHPRPQRGSGFLDPGKSPREATEEEAGP
ncbi:hypothetical protein CsSME_00039498 [Camellia sinensis var. sinensis]